jgi:hypothetical protein
MKLLSPRDSSGSAKVLHAGVQTGLPTRLRRIRRRPRPATRRAFGSRANWLRVSWSAPVSAGCSITGSGLRRGGLLYFFCSALLWRACYVLLDGETIRYRRVEYAIDSTVQKIYAIPDLENFLGDRLRDGR